jgi:hypothetical protein
MDLMRSSFLINIWWPVESGWRIVLRKGMEEIRFVRVSCAGNQDPLDNTMLYMYKTQYVASDIGSDLGELFFS